MCWAEAQPGLELWPAAPAHQPGMHSSLCLPTELGDALDNRLLGWSSPSPTLQERNPRPGRGSWNFSGRAQGTASARISNLRHTLASFHGCVLSGLCPGNSVQDSVGICYLKKRKKKVWKALFLFSR